MQNSLPSDDTILKVPFDTGSGSVRCLLLTFSSATVESLLESRLDMADVTKCGEWVME